jgi:hypothetical protein
VTVAGTGYEWIVTMADGEEIHHVCADDEWLEFEVSHSGSLLVKVCTATPYDILRRVASAYAPGEWSQADRLAK